MKAWCGTSRTAPLGLGQLDAGGRYGAWLMAPSGLPLTSMSESTIASHLR